MLIYLMKLRFLSSGHLCQVYKNACSANRVSGQVTMADSCQYAMLFMNGDGHHACDSVLCYRYVLCLHYNLSENKATKA